MAVLKVEREALIKMLEQEKIDAEKQFKSDLKKYNRDRETYSSRMLAALHKLEAQVKRGYIPEGRYRGLPEFPEATFPKTPIKPNINGRICEIEGFLRILRLSTDKHIRVNEGSRYFRFACKL